MPAKPQPPPGGNVDIGWKLEVGTTVTFLSAAIVVALRCFARWKYSQRGWDDYLMVFALLQALVATIVDFVAVNHGLGRHTFYLTHEQSVNQQYYSLLAQVFCVQALSFAKMSIVVSYMRVLRDSGNRLHQVLLWAIGILVFVVNTMVIITFYTGCNPTEKSWDPLTKGTCWTTNKKLAFFLLQGAFSAFSDFFLAFSPFFFLHKLQVKKRTKALILGLMGLGTVTGVFAIIRTVETGTQLNPPPTAVPDGSFSTVLGLTWAGMERNIAILAGSIPALNPLAAPATRLIKQTLGSSASRLRSTTSHSYQLSDIPQPRKLPDDDSRQQNYATEWNQKTSAPVTNTSEEHILPMQGQVNA
ncbi:hypothetical protein F4781DRAFT_74041 [Annulohypoxylon bovei var. microspora]|nr:hypothetical protein F4781DRAFT_74041 [Annulohypoxylon bovei var. microspora]